MVEHTGFGLQLDRYHSATKNSYNAVSWQGFGSGTSVFLLHYLDIRYIVLSDMLK